MTAQTIRIEKSFGLSFGAHALLLLFGFALQMFSVQPKQEITPVEIVFMEVPAHRSDEGVGLAKRSGGVQAAPKRAGFSSLLAQATKGLSGAALSGVKKGPSTDIKRMTEGLRKNLLAQAQGAAAKAGAQAALPGQLKSGAAVRWDLLQTQPQGAASQTMSIADREAIRKIIAAREGAFRNCHEKALLTDAALSGEAELLFTLSSSGQVSRTDVRYSGHGSSQSQSKLAECIRTVGRQIRFPGSVAKHQVRFTLVLR